LSLTDLISSITSKCAACHLRLDGARVAYASEYLVSTDRDLRYTKRVNWDKFPGLDTWEASIPDWVINCGRCA
jgi:hypothetical protein